MKRTKTKLSIFTLVLMFTIITYSCNKNQYSESQSKTIEHADWLRDAVVYEVNVRQYSEEGSFNAVAEDMPRLASLGVDILWFMPVHPIGEKNRKGSLGSYYSVKDYKGINKDFGTFEDFKNLVEKAHEHGLKVIIDWVPNHSSWDNELTIEHPEFYKKDSTGNFISPFDWTDVIQFDYENKDLWNYMIVTMKFWIEETNIDGFRCDVAHMVPVEFWNEVRPALMDVKEIFLLAESDQPFLHEKAFDATYDWKLHHIINEVANENMDADDIRNHYAYVDSAYPSNSILLEFTSNHDENSWNGTVFERLGEAAECFAVFKFTIPGMPLIYNGQEVCLDKRLEFFEKDQIEWKECEFTSLYKKLTDLKEDNKALWAGDEGGEMKILNTVEPDRIFAFIRTRDDNSVLSVFNFSDSLVTIVLPEDLPENRFTDYFTGDVYSEVENLIFSVPPWGYNILVN